MWCIDTVELQFSWILMVHILIRSYPDMWDENVSEVQALFSFCRLTNTELGLKNDPEATMKPQRERRESLPRSPWQHTCSSLQHHPWTQTHKSVWYERKERDTSRHRERQRETRQAFQQFLITLHTTPNNTEIYLTFWSGASASIFNLTPFSTNTMRHTQGERQTERESTAFNLIEHIWTHHVWVDLKFNETKKQRLLPPRASKNQQQCSKEVVTVQVHDTQQL